MVKVKQTGIKMLSTIVSIIITSLNQIDLSTSECIPMLIFVDSW